MIYRKRGMNKRGSSFLFDQIIFLLIIVAFSVIMMVFVSRAGNQATLKEQIYSKQIALAIDKARPGTQITMDLAELYRIKKTNKYEGNLLSIDNVNKKVIVQLTSGKGYSYSFFSDSLITWNIDEMNKGAEKLTIFSN
jgi:hypothetical protein